MRHMGTQGGSRLVSATVHLGLAAGGFAVTSGAALAQSDIAPPGIYTQIEARALSDAVAPMQILMGCTAAPIVFHPDGMVVSKRLDSGAARGVAYADQEAGRCRLDAGTLYCGGALVGSAFDEARMTVLERGHLEFGRADGSIALLGRCDPQTLVAAAPDGSALDAVLARGDGGVALDPADTIMLAGNDFDPAQFGAGDADRPATAEDPASNVTLVADAGNSLPPGIYALGRGGYENPQDLEYDRAFGCSRQPAVFYPDGRLLLKELDQTMAEIGLPPYGIRMDAQCGLEGGIVTCSGENFREFGGPGEPSEISGLFAAAEGGNFSIDADGQVQQFLACNLADLDQHVDGISVLAEIIRRPDPGPFPDLGDIRIDTADLNSIARPEITLGDWDGSYVAYFSEGLGEARVDVVHTADNPDQVFARLGFNIGPDADECARILGASLCEDLEVNSGWAESVRGTVIDGERLLVAYEQGLWQSGVERELRLVELVRNAEGGFRLTRYSPNTGLDLVVEGIVSPNLCEQGQFSLVDLTCERIGLQRIGLAGGSVPAAETDGLFATAPERVAPLLTFIAAGADTDFDTAAVIQHTAIETGPWHGSFNLSFLETGLDFGVDIAQPIGVSYAWGEIYSELPTGNLDCAQLDSLRCDEYNWLGSGGQFQTVGTLLYGDRALIAIELGGSVAGDSRLRLLDIHRQGSTAELVYYHPNAGRLFSAAADRDSHWCDDTANRTESFCADTRARMDDMVFSDGAEFIGIFGEANEGLDELLSHAPHLAGLMAQAPAPSGDRAASDADWGGLPPGIWTNLLGYPPDGDHLARSCTEAPSVSYADGTIISKELIGDRYTIQSVFSCLPQPGGGIGCRVSDGVEELATLSSVQFRQGGETTEICYALEGQTQCDTLHRCSADILPADRIQSIITRTDGGVPLALR